VAGQIDPRDLVSAADIADRLELSHANVVHSWRRRHPEFPEPIVVREGMLLWLWPQVEAWLRETGRLE